MASFLDDLTSKFQAKPEILECVLFRVGPALPRLGVPSAVPALFMPWLTSASGIASHRAALSPVRRGGRS